MLVNIIVIIAFILFMGWGYEQLTKEDSSETLGGYLAKITIVLIGLYVLHRLWVAYNP